MFLNLNIWLRQSVKSIIYVLVFIQLIPLIAYASNIIVLVCRFVYLCNISTCTKFLLFVSIQIDHFFFIINNPSIIIILLLKSTNILLNICYYIFTDFSYDKLLLIPIFTLYWIFGWIIDDNYLMILELQLNYFSRTWFFDFVVKDMGFNKLLVSHFIYTMTHDFLTPMYDRIDIFNSMLIPLWIAILFIYLILIILFIFNKTTISYNFVYSIVNISLIIQTVIITYLLWIRADVIFNSNIQIYNNLFNINIFQLKIDKLALRFLLIIYLIGTAVNSYQFLYLENILLKERFFIKLNLFIISMFFVILSYNWILLLLSWEMLGQTSFFLIGFFKTKIAGIKSSIKAFIFNRISDLMLFISFILSYKLNNSTTILITTVNQLSGFIGLFICLASLIKSAQFCFYFWLPDSMEAPIPASALIHSATLVSAGMYLILRFIIYVESTDYNIYLLQLSSIISMILFSLIASTQTDIKKLLAYSTISNCAFIYLLISLCLYDFAVLYFAIHGLLKSLCFIIAGILIKNQKHQQDIRNWIFIDLRESLTVVILITSILMLGASPISIVYTLKTYIYNLNIYGVWKFIIFKLILVLYSLNSYNYSIKIITYFYFKNKHTQSTTDNNIQNDIRGYRIIYIYFICILIYLYNIDIEKMDLTLLVYYFNTLLVLVPLNIICVYYYNVNVIPVMFIVVCHWLLF